MITGLLFGLGACFIWGFIFAIPQYLSDFSPVEVMIGRYSCYGALSLCLFLRRGWSRFRSYPLRVWTTALLFALLTNVLYYLSLIAGMRFASSTLTILLSGLAPIVIAFYGNWQQREVAYRDLVLPSLCMVIGLLLVHATDSDWSFQATTLPQYIMGVTGMFLALFLISWFTVNNARFLKNHPQVSADAWTTILGVATLFWVVMICILMGLLSFYLPIRIESYIDVHSISTSPRYLIGIAILGILCSWVGCFLWSQASTRLPISLVGPLLVFETLFGLVFVFILHQQFPTWTELLGISALIGGMLLCFQTFKKSRRYPS